MKAISAGGMHSSCITKQGVVFVWGSNSNGQCGISPRQFATLPVPQVLKELPPNYEAAMAACGFAHTLILMSLKSRTNNTSEFESSRVYSMGLNSTGQVSC